MFCREEVEMANRIYGSLSTINMMQYSSSQYPPKIGNSVFQSRYLSKKRGIQRKQYNESKLLSALEMMPGFQHILKSKNAFFKFVWFLIIFVSIILCLYQISVQCRKYESQPTSTVVSVEEKYKMNFPVFTFCPIVGEYTPLLREAQQLAKERKLNNMTCGTTFEDLVASRKYDPRSIWMKMSLETEIGAELIQFMSVWPYTNSVTRNITSTLTEFGNCASYHIYDPQPVSSNYRFRVKISTDSNQCRITKLAGLYHYHGMEYDVVYSSKDIVAIVLNEYIVYDFSVQIFHIVNKTKQICKSTKEVSDCRRHCIEDYIVKNISCRLPFMCNEDLPPCKTWRELNNTQAIVIRLAQSIDFNCNCPKPCDRVIYNRNLIASRPRFHGNFSVFDFYFGDNFIITFTEYLNYTFISLLCDIGGNLGLFLGMCILTIIDIAQQVIFSSLNGIIQKVK